MLNILIPVLRRPHRIAPLMESITATTPNGNVLFIASPSDEAEIEALQKEGVKYVVMDADYEGNGDYARKINYGYQITTEPFIFLGADDLRFHPNWFERASTFMVGRIGVVGTNDLGNSRVKAGQHSTHSLVSRAYIDRYGTIDERGKVLHEGYPHEFVDDELVGTARRRHAWAFARYSIVEHLHPNWGKAPMDSLYAAQHQRMADGTELFRRRSRLWR